MSKTHLQTAHEYGVKEALKKCGYASVEEINKEAAELGLLEQAPATTDKVGSVIEALKLKLG